jgi:hypothetical protein
MKVYTLSFLCLLSVHGFGQTISFEDYFPLKKGDVKYFYVHQITGTDTLKDKNAQSVCRSQVVKGTGIYYFSDEPGTKNDLVSANVFCDGVCYYDHGAFLVSPLSWTDELKEANIAYFDTLFPAQLALNTRYKQQDGEEKRICIVFAGRVKPVLIRTITVAETDSLGDWGGVIYWFAMF